MKAHFDKRTGLIGNQKTFICLFIRIFLMTVVLVVVLGLIVFLPAMSKVFDFTTNAQTNITTVITNLATPILAVASAVLLYLALSRQTESNIFHVEKNDIDLFFTLYNQLNAEYSNMTVKVSGTRGTERYLEIYHGHQALIESLPLIRSKAHNFAILFETDKFMSIISTFKITEEVLNSLNIQPALKSKFHKKLGAFYQYKLRPAFLLVAFLIRANKDQISIDFLSFTTKNELKIDPDFDIHQFEQESDVFKSELNKPKLN